MQLLVCPECKKPSMTWKFAYQPAVIEGVFAAQNKDVTIKPPLVVRNTINPEEAIVNNIATVTCPKCGAVTSFHSLSTMTICDISQKAVSVRVTNIVVQYRMYGSSTASTYSLELEVDELFSEEELLRLFAID